MQDLRWYERGTCFRTETTLADFSDDDNPEPALAICAVCPVRGQCLLADFEETLESGLTDGIRGGYTKEQRIKLFVEWEPHYKVPMKRRRLRQNE